MNYLGTWSSEQDTEKNAYCPEVSFSSSASFVDDQHSGWSHTYQLLLVSSLHTSYNTQSFRIKP